MLRRAADKDAEKGKLDAAKADAGAAPPPEYKPKKLADIQSEEDLMSPGTTPGSVPTDLEHAVGLERLEIIAKMEGVDIFDMKPLDASRMGTLDNPIMVKSWGDEQYAGCTGFPADSHNTIWLALSRGRPMERCPECGNVLKMQYVGPPVPPDPNSDGKLNYDEPKNFSYYVRREYHGYPPGFNDF